MRTSTIALAFACLLASASLPAQPAAPAKFDTEAWKKPTDPFRVAGSIHYVGTADLAAYLITTSEGHILLDGVLTESAPGLEASIRTLGFKPEDIRVLLISQAHFDHVGSLAHMQRVSRARVEVMKGDDTIVASGGKTDYLFANEPAAHFPPVRVDRVLRDGDTVRVGDVTLTARHTPGHTPGTTTWLTTVREDGRSYRVVFPGSTTINPGTRLVDRPSYPGIADDFRRSLALLESLEPEIFLAAHASFFGLAEKRARMASQGVAAWIDPASYKSLHAAKRAAFEEQLAREKGASK
jgi:metallo-beta-lactamase class B